MTNRIISLCAVVCVLGTGCTEQDSSIRPALANWETPDAGLGSSYAALESGDAYPVCSWDDSESCPAVDDRGHRGSYSFGPENGCWNASQCRNACEVDADCPTPRSGGVTPECFHGMCVLPCGDAGADVVDGAGARPVVGTEDDVVPPAPGGHCPTGMACARDGSRDVSWCMWVSDVGTCD